MPVLSFKSLALGALLVEAVDGARVVKKEKAQQTVIAGVPVYNYHMAFDHGRWGDSFVQAMEGRKTAGEESWMLYMRDGISESQMEVACSMHVECRARGHADGVPFMELLATEEELTRFLEEEADKVLVVEPDMPVEATPEVLSTEEEVPWGLRRIRVRDLSSMPSDDPGPANGGAGVHAYVLDTGIRTTHKEFEGRAIPTVEVDVLGVTARECKPGETDCAQDGQGHGTHCAGTIGGANYGVAKGVTIHAVKVLMDNGAGTAFSILRGMDWVAKKAQKPAIASMSLGGAKSFLSNRGVAAMTRNGVIVVTASGNSNADACGFSPGSAPTSINVGATDPNDSRSSFSCFGKCLDIWAPGRDILSSVHDDDTASKAYSGTSMACPHVSGAVALLLQEAPSLTWAEVKAKLIDQATPNVVTDAKDKSPNLMLFSPP